MNSRYWIVAVVGVGLNLFPAMSSGEDQTPAAENEKPAVQEAAAGATEPAVPTITRVYNVRDLLTDLPDFPAAPMQLPGAAAPSSDAKAPQQNLFGGVGAGAPGNAMGGGGSVIVGAGVATTTGGPPPGPLTRADELVQLIEESVASDSWKDSGGQIGGVRLFNGGLVITQTAENHEKIRKLLTELRGDEFALVHIRARWVLLMAADVDRIVKHADPGAKPALQEVSEAELDKVAGRGVQFRAQTTCFSGQTVSLASGRQKSVVSTVEAVVGTGVGAYQPTVGFLNSGLTLEIKPTFNREEKNVVMTLASTFTGPSEIGPKLAAKTVVPTSQPSANGPAEDSGPGVFIDRVSTLSQKLNTTVRIPVDKPILIGGMTLEPAAAGEESPQLYLIIDVSASQ